MSERSSDQIRRDIERTRADMDETVDALENKLSPGELLDELWSRVKSGGGDFGSVLGDSVRDHPVPLALVGAGLAWLAVEQATQSRGDRLRKRHGDVGPGTWAPAEGRVGPYLGDDVVQPDRESGQGVGEKAAGAAADAKEKAAGAMHAVGDKATDVKHRAQDGVEHARDHAHDLGERASRTAARAGRGIERGFFSALEDHPLALGAVTFGLGIAAGVSVPTTRAEDELMGRTSQTLKDEASRVGHEAGEQIKHVARDAARTARDEADRQGLRGDLGHKIEQVAKSARDAARDTAREEGLSGDRLKERGREAVERTRETATEEARRRSR